MFNFFNLFRDSSMRVAKSPSVSRLKTGLFQRPGLEILEDRKVPAALSLGGSVYDDKNGNGIRETTEPGLAGISMELRNNSGTLVASAVTTANGAYQFDRFNGLPVQVVSQRQEQLVNPGKSNYTKDLTFAGFDGTMGTLERVDLVLTSDGSTVFKAENLEAMAETISMTPKGTFRAAMPGLSALDLIVNPGTSTMNLGAYDGLSDFGGGSGKTLAPVSLSGTQTISFTTAESLAAFTKNQVALAVSSRVGIATEGPGNELTQSTSSVGLKVALVYQYRAVPPIEPGTYTITEVNQPTGYIDGAITLNNVAPVPGSIGQKSIVVTLGSTSINTINFAELKAASLAGLVRMIPDSFSSPSVSGAGLGSILVSLRGTNDMGQSVSADKTTNGDGSYTFGDLRPGTYTLTAVAGKLIGVDAQAGTSGGTAGINSISSISLANGSTATNYIFNEINPAALVGMAYQDKNDNGIFDGSDTVLANNKMILTGIDYKSRAVTVETTTDNFGDYSFGSILPGTYTVTASTPTGMIASGVKAGSCGGTVDGASVKNIRLGQTDFAEGYDFPFVNPAKVSGFVFNDKNNDGTRAGTSNGTVNSLAVDPGVANVTVNLTGSDTAGRPVSLTTKTLADGAYNFPNLKPGTYKIQIVTPPGYMDGKSMSGSAGGSSVNANTISGLSLSSGQDAVNYNFALIKPTVIKGFVGNDIAKNNRRDVNDPGLARIVVILSGVDANGKTVSRQATTDVNGNYSFGSIAPGVYKLQLAQTPAGWSAPVTTVGTIGGKSVGQTLALAVGQDQTGIGYNFLLQATGLSKRQYINTVA
jgi:protocatechuate 3,4-dioxygenase beta subunit